MKLLRPAVLQFAAVLLVGSAQSAPVTFTFTAIVRYSTAAGVPVNSLATGSYGFDSTAPDQYPLARGGTYDGNDFRIQLPSQEVVIPEISIEVDITEPTPTSYRMFGVNTTTRASVNMQLTFFAPSPFTDDSLPTDPSFFAAALPYSFNEMPVTLDYEAFQTEDISLEITSLTRVPEPLSLALCSLGALLGLYRRRP